MHSANANKRRRPRRLLFITAALLLTFVVCEGIAAVGWWMATGSGFSYAEATDMRQQAQGRDDLTFQEAAAQQALTGHILVHPFLGYNLRPTGPVLHGRPHLVNQYGLIDDRNPFREQSADRYIILLTGGSVAAQVSLYAPDVFTAELQKIPALADREIDIVRLALGGYKQPQQLIGLQYLHALGAKFDCVINLDGFNEVALVQENLRDGVTPFFPRGWRGLTQGFTSLDKQLAIGRLQHLRERRAEMARQAEMFAWSVVGQTVWLLRDQQAQSALAKASQAAEATDDGAPLPYEVRGPAPGTPQQLAARTVEAADIWARSSIAMAAT